MYSGPNGITLDAAAVRPNSLLNCLTVSDWSSLTLFMAVRSIRYEQETDVPALLSNSIPCPDKWFSVVEKAHFSWHVALTPALS